MLTFLNEIKRGLEILLRLSAGVNIPDNFTTNPDLNENDQDWQVWFDGV